MLRIDLICLGGLKEKYWRDACAEYGKRLSRWCSLRVIELPEAKIPYGAGEQQIAAALEAEGQRILARIPKKAHMVALCVEGGQVTSGQMADHISQLMSDGVSCVVFIIGSSHGLSPAVKRGADERFSLSELTFPHQLARVMLLEQIYRAFSILNGGKYDK